jgi:hypothetical protein
MKIPSMRLCGTPSHAKWSGSVVGQDGVLLETRVALRVYLGGFEITDIES